MRVVCVDDDETILKTMARAMQRAGHEVVQTFTDPFAFLEWMPMGQKLEGFDLVLSDVQMPGITGFEMIQSARALGYLFPVMFVSGMEKGKDVWAKENLVDTAFSLKPFKVPELLEAAEALVDARKKATTLV